MCDTGKVRYVVEATSDEVTQRKWWQTYGRSIRMHCTYSKPTCIVFQALQCQPFGFIYSISSSHWNWDRIHSVNLHQIQFWFWFLRDCDYNVWWSFVYLQFAGPTLFRNDFEFRECFASFSCVCCVWCVCVCTQCCQMSTRTYLQTNEDCMRISPINYVRIRSLAIGNGHAVAGNWLTEWHFCDS